MKKLILSVILITISTISFGQSGSSFGIKGGLNYGSNGNFINSVEETINKPDKNLGFHLGLYGKLGGAIYFKPELVYTKTKSEYENGDLKIQKLDAPLLVGIKLIGPLSIFAGPSLQLILDSKFEDLSVKNIEKDFSVGFNFGVGVNLGRIGIDVRYERGFNENEAVFIDNTTDIDITDRIDVRPEQVILSLSIDI